MTNVEKIAGFDVSKLFFDVCLCNQGVLCQKQFANDASGFKQLLTMLPPETHCIMEATGPYYLQLACFLYEQAMKVSVVNPLVIRRFSQMRLTRAKTDKTDAKIIMDYGIKEAPSAWEPPKAYVIQLQQLQALSSQLQKHYRALSNQQEAFFVSGLMQKELGRFLKKELARIQDQLDTIEKQMHQIITQYHGQLMAQLTSIPGLGKKTAMTLIVLSGGFKKFSNYKQLSAYVGLSPRIYESGSSVKGRARICKMGMGKIRALLYVCAWSAKRCNSACKELYDRLVTNGKNKRLALIAVANKLIKQAFAIATSNSLYDKNYSKNI